LEGQTTNMNEMNKILSVDVVIMAKL